ncbi:MAG: hypothetical protein WBD27_18960 [Pyrinomonadaceae bacterium]
MPTVTMLSVTGNSKYDGKGSVPLTRFKHLGATNKPYCEADAEIWRLENELRLVKLVRAVECRFEDPGNEFNNFAVNLEGIHRRQEVTGFETNRLFAVYVYVTDDLKSQIPAAKDRGVKLKDVQILDIQKSGKEIAVSFSGMDAKTNI